jgi:hypothetical protein
MPPGNAVSYTVVEEACCADELSAIAPIHVKPCPAVQP